MKKLLFLHLYFASCVASGSVCIGEFYFVSNNNVPKCHITTDIDSHRCEDLVDYWAGIFRSEEGGLYSSKYIWLDDGAAARYQYQRPCSPFPKKRK